TPTPAGFSENARMLETIKRLRFMGASKAIDRPTARRWAGGWQVCPKPGDGRKSIPPPSLREVDRDLERLALNIAEVAEGALAMSAELRRCAALYDIVLGVAA